MTPTPKEGRGNNTLRSQKPLPPPRDEEIESKEGPPTPRGLKAFFVVIAAPCVSTDRGAQKRILDLHQNLAEEALEFLTDEALERDEKRRELFKDSHNTLKGIIRAFDDGNFVNGKYPPRAYLRIAREQIAAMKKLDALPPA